MTTIPCEVCGGVGLVMARDPNMPDDGSQDPWEMTECLACDGAGLFRSEVPW